MAGLLDEKNAGQFRAAAKMVAGGLREERPSAGEHEEVRSS